MRPFPESDYSTSCPATSLGEFKEILLYSLTVGTNPNMPDPFEITMAVSHALSLPSDEQVTALTNIVKQAITEGYASGLYEAIHTLSADTVLKLKESLSNAS